MTTYITKWRDGSTSTSVTLQDAIDLVASAYPEAEIGHAGDLADGGDRTLCWADEESSADDDGARAVASIRRVVGGA